MTSDSTETREHSGRRLTEASTQPERGHGNLVSTESWGWSLGSGMCGNIFEGRNFFRWRASFLGVEMRTQYGQTGKPRRLWEDADMTRLDHSEEDALQGRMVLC